MGFYNRREFLKIGGGLLAASILPVKGFSALIPENDFRHLSFYNTHTGEELSVCYFKNDTYCPHAMASINHILRDHRTGEIKAIDPMLLDRLARIQQELDCQSPFHIISGYRSPKTNAFLRKRSTGVAKNSYHMQGRAIDIRLPGCNTQKLRRTCLNLKEGGVGYYPSSDFIHLDTGDFRAWRG